MAKAKVQLFKDPLNGKLYTIKGDRVRQYPAGTTIHKNGKSSDPFTNESFMSQPDRACWALMIGLISV